MVRTIISVILVGIIVTAGALYEGDFVKRQFEEMNSAFTLLNEKVDSHTAIEDDVVAVQKNWTEKKRYLHIFIPHNEIKEFDLWIAETIILVRDKKWSDALSKIKVLINLSVEIPKSFAITLENIF